MLYTIILLFYSIMLLIFPSILHQSFREEMVTKDAMSHSLMTLFFGNIDPLYDFHCSFLAELEDRLFSWYSSCFCSSVCIAENFLICLMIYEIFGANCML